MVAIGDMMSPIKNVALVNQLGQVVNHVIVDTDDTETIEALHEQWGTHRYVETTEEDVIILHSSEEVWTTHCDSPDCDTKGFTLPDHAVYMKALGIELPVFNETEELSREFEEITIKGRKYPDDSLLIKENAAKRPIGWVLPDGVEEVSLVDKE
jgi:hypothetical protein